MYRDIYSLTNTHVTFESEVVHFKVYRTARCEIDIHISVIPQLNPERNSRVCHTNENRKLCSKQMIHQKIIAQSYDLILYTLCPLTPLPFFLIRQYILKKYRSSKKSAIPSLFSLMKYQINLIQSRCMLTRYVEWVVCLDLIFLILKLCPLEA